MPKMDGFETCLRLKGCKATGNIPVIYMLDIRDEKTKATCFETGGVDYITKPFYPEEVLTRISTHIALKENREIWLAQQV